MRKDMDGEWCERCGKGHYKETSLMDDIWGVLHCDKCGYTVSRWQGEDEPKMAVDEFEGKRATTDKAKERVMARLLEAWKKVPQLRLGQLIVNACGKDPYYREDDELVAEVEAMVTLAKMSE